MIKDTTYSASKIRKYRIQLQLSQSEFAQLLGTNQVTVSRWESGTSTPSKYYRKALALLIQQASMPGSSKPSSTAQPVVKEATVKYTTNTQQQIDNSEFYRERTIEELIAEQNVAPANFKKLLGDFWPKDESIDDFIKFYRELRNRG
jgi:transcriptional regulator with XRE-family HTH domain